MFHHRGKSLLFHLERFVFLRHSFLLCAKVFAGGTETRQGDLHREDFFLEPLFQRGKAILARGAVCFLLHGQFPHRVLQDLEELCDALHLVASAVAALLVLLVSFLGGTDLGLEELKFGFERFDSEVVEDGEEVFRPDLCEEVVACVLDEPSFVVESVPQFDDVVDE